MAAIPALERFLKYDVRSATDPDRMGLASLFAGTAEIDIESNYAWSSKRYKIENH